MQNIGEEICGEYLKYIKECEFITYNVTNPDIQGEIDVIGINLQNKILYVCEVAVHTYGLQYVKDKRPDDYNRFMAKIEKDITYAKKYFPEFNIKPMIWSPIVKISGENAKYNTLLELQRVVEDIKLKFNLSVELIINKRFNDCLQELKEYTDKETAEFKSNVMRLFQIERSLEKHLRKLSKKGLMD